MGADLIVGLLKGLAEGSKVLLGTDKPVEHVTVEVGAPPPPPPGSIEELRAQARTIKKDE